MVAPTETSELQEATEESTEEVVSEDAPEETPEPSEEETPDPIQGVLERLGKHDEALAALSGLDPSTINPALGRISGLQSDVSKLQGTDPLAALDPRFAANEALTAAVAEALINADSELVNDQSKAVLRASVTEANKSKEVRDRDTAVAEAVAKAVAATTPEQSTPQPDTDAQTVVAGMRDQLVGYALAKDVEYASIPANVLQFQANETIETAFERVKTHIDGMVNEDDAVDRLAERQGAASSTPSRAGGTVSIEDKKTRLEAGELPGTETAARKAIADSLGLALPT